MSNNAVDRYADDVVAGRLPAGKYHRLACARHLADRARERTASFPYYFDLGHAERFFRFAGRMQHYKGAWAGQLLVLSPFQVFRLGCVFGWRCEGSGWRRFTTAYNELPRKQGKSLEAAVVAIYVTFFEGEPGAEGYCVATKEKQAADVVFRDIKRLVQASPSLKRRLTVQVKNVHHDASASKLEPLGSDSETLDGLNPQSITTDELHAFKDRGLLDVLESATGARRNPLHYQITTAGNDPVSVCGDQHNYACQVLDGVLDDLASRTFFACIAHADPGDDWTSETTWRKANPHYGLSVTPDDIRKLCEKAQAMPSAAAEFKQKRLNLWVNASNPCLSLEGWRLGQSNVTREAWLSQVRGLPCYVGVDLASTIDLMAATALFPPASPGERWRLVQAIWTPGDTIQGRAHRDRAPYVAWRDQGWLESPPGKTLDAELVRHRILEWRAVFRILQIGFDPWHADAPIQNLKALDGFAEEQVVGVPQTYAGLSSAEGRFQAEVLEGRVDANSCPVTAWAVSNTVDQQDGKGNIFFTKKKSRGRIDPVKSATTAMALAIRAEAVPEKKFQMIILGARSSQATR